MNRLPLLSRGSRLLILILVLILPAASHAQAASGVGFSPIEVADPVSGGRMAGFVFYPAAHANGVTKLGPYELNATAGADPLPGRKPLILISHGHGGSDLGHHDLATYLAARGFIVAAITHPRDNVRDSSGDGQAVVLGGRPRQVSATISYLLASTRWKSLIDRDRIGVAGFSNGGYTALLFVGARPNFTMLPRHCKLHPDDRNIRGPLAKLEAQAALGHRTIEQIVETLQRGLFQWGDTSDSRVKAAFVMAPFSSPFDAPGLAGVHRPLLLYYAGDDQVLLPRFNSLHIAPLIRTLVALRKIPRAGHYVFLSPCSTQLADEASDICTGPHGTDRVALHRKIDADAVRFFRTHLH